jgi:hypothetical protein
MIPNELKQIVKQTKTEQNAEDFAQYQATKKAQEAITDVIKNRTQAEINALPTEQRQREYGMTPEEKLAYTESHNLNPDFSSKENNPGVFAGNGIIGDIITGGLGLAAALVTGGLIAGGTTAAAAGEAAAALPSAVAPVAGAVAPVAAPVGSIVSSSVIGAGGSTSMGLFDSILKVATSPGGSSIIGSLVGGGSSQSAAQAAAASANQQTTDVAKLALTLAQQAALGQANMTVSANGSTLNTNNQTTPVWLWPVVIVVGIVAAVGLLIAAFRRK